MARDVEELWARFGRARPSSLRGRALRQAVREVLLAAASDWPFLLASDGGGDIARARWSVHARRFTYLANALRTGREIEVPLDMIETLDDLFSHPVW